MATTPLVTGDRKCAPIGLVIGTHKHMRAGLGEGRSVKTPLITVGREPATQMLIILLAAN